MTLEPGVPELKQEISDLESRLQNARSRLAVVSPHDSESLSQSLSSPIPPLPAGMLSFTDEHCRHISLYGILLTRYAFPSN